MRERGYSLDYDEVVVGVRCVGMPILDRSGRAVGAMSVSGTSDKQPGPALDRLVALLSEACGYVSRRLGYAGAYPPATPADDSPAATARHREICMRIAWVMKLKPGNEAIYKQKHDEIWPEMLALMQKSGTRNYSIYRYGLLLFAYQERDTPAEPGAPIDPIVWKWWEMMAPYMETNSDFSPVTEPVEEMFHAD